MATAFHFFVDNSMKIFSSIIRFVQRRTISLLPYLRLLRSKNSLMPEGLPPPPLLHVEYSNLKSRQIIVGDVHGCFDELQDLLSKCALDENTSLIFVGDLVTKGPKSAEVVNFVRKSGALCVRGNHDDSALARALKLKPTGTDGKFDYIPQLSSEDISWLSNLPYTITLPQINSVIVHAGLMPSTPMHLQLPETCSRIRNIVNDSTTTTTTELKASEGHKKGEPWASLWIGPQHIYFGHDAKRGLQKYQFATGLDTGCCYGRQLTAMILPERRIVQVNAKQVHTKADE
eukprot:gene4270-8498_t